MKSLQTSHRHDVHTDAQIIAACQSAANAEVDYAMQALIAGQMLIEKRASMSPSSHDGKTGRFNPKADQDNFGKWLESHRIPVSTAYRWIDCADRVMRSRLGLSMIDDIQPYIEVEGTVIPHSQILTLPEAELPDAARKLRQDVFGFMQDKTLGEAARAAFGGDSPSHRITRAANGKAKGGTRGEDRKDWPTYIARHLSDVTGLLGCNEKNREKRYADMTAGQRQKIEDAFATALTKWPTPLVEHLAKLAREEGRNR